MERSLKYYKEDVSDEERQRIQPFVNILETKILSFKDVMEIYPVVKKIVIDLDPLTVRNLMSINTTIRNYFIENNVLKTYARKKVGKTRLNDLETRLSALGDINYIWFVIANTYRNKTTSKTHLKFFYNGKEIMYIENKNEEDSNMFIIFTDINVDQRYDVLKNIQKVFNNENVYILANGIEIENPEEEDLLVLIYACFHIPGFVFAVSEIKKNREHVKYTQEQYKFFRDEIKDYFYI